MASGGIDANPTIAAQVLSIIYHAYGQFTVFGFSPPPGLLLPSTSQFIALERTSRYKGEREERAWRNPTRTHIYAGFSFVRSFVRSTFLSACFPLQTSKEASKPARATGGISNHREEIRPCSSHPPSSGLPPSLSPLLPEWQCPNPLFGTWAEIHPPPAVIL